VNLAHSPPPGKPEIFFLRPAKLLVHGVGFRRVAFDREIWEIDGMTEPAIHPDRMKPSRPLRLGPPPRFAAPSKKWYIAAAALFLVGVLGGTTWILLALTLVRPAVMEMAAPGAMVYDAEVPGRYSLIGRLTAENGRVNWTAESAAAGLRIRLADAQTGESLPVQPTLGWRARGRAGGTEYSLGSFQMPAPGRVSIRVEGVSPIRVIGVQRAQADHLMWALIGGSLLNALGWLVAPIWAFQIYYRRVRAEFLAIEYS